jgi:hypothetical protein
VGECVAHDAGTIGGHAPRRGTRSGSYARASDVCEPCFSVPGQGRVEPGLGVQSTAARLAHY